MSCPFRTQDILQQSDGLRSTNREGSRHVMVAHGESLHHGFVRVDRLTSNMVSPHARNGADWARIGGQGGGLLSLVWTTLCA